MTIIPKLGHSRMANIRYCVALLTLCIIFTLCNFFHRAYAGDISAVLAIDKVQLNGLSLNSTADEITDFIAANPNLKCKNTDTPERQSKLANRPPSPRQRNWNCAYSHPTNSQILKVQMTAEFITRLSYETGYDSDEDHDKITNYIRTINDDLKKAGLKEKSMDSNNYSSYKETETEGASNPIFMQHLYTKISPKCDGKSAFFKLSISSSKIPSQNVYRAALKIERNLNSVNCHSRK